MRSVAGHHDLMLRGEHGSGPSISRAARVWAGVTRYRWAPAARRPPGKASWGTGRRESGPRRIEPVQVVRHLGVRPFVPGLGLRVAGTDAAPSVMPRTPD